MKFVVKESQIAGKGSFAAKDIEAGEHILFFEGEEVPLADIKQRIAKGTMRADDDIQISDNFFLDIPKTSPSYFVNHSCDPSAGMRGQKELFALKRIEKGEEITFDYSTSYDESCDQENIWSMRCSCGSEKCRGMIGGIGTVPRDVLERYVELGALPDFVMGKVTQI